MPDKKSASRLSANIPEGQKQCDSNLHPVSSNVKLPFQKKSQEDLDCEYLVNTFTRFQLQQVAQNELVGRFESMRNLNYAKCHRATFAGLVSLVRNPETRRAFYDGVITCASPILCPVCAPRIMGKRSAEIKKAVHAWLNESSENTCYLLTLTFAHTAVDKLSDLLKAFKLALKNFWENGSLKRLVNGSGRVGRITATEIQVSEKNGWHPHQHILLFCKKTLFVMELLYRCWLNALTAVGLSGLSDIALDLVEARSAECYLTKISSEMAMGNLKEGRGQGHFSPFQLIHEMASGSAWAVDRFCELFWAVRGLHSLCWSRGLKSRFGIKDVSDQAITDGDAQPELLHFLDIFSEGYRALPVPQKALLRNYAAMGDYDRALSLLDKFGAQIYNREGGGA